MTARGPARALFGWAVFALALGFYLSTLQPSLAWGDGTRLQREAITGESFILAEMVQADFAPDPLPFARLGVAAWDHPLYVMLAHAAARLIPLGSALWRVNVVSAVCGAGAAALVAVLVFRHTGSAAASLAASGALVVSHTFWFHAVTPEVYSLLALLILAALAAWDRCLARPAPRLLFAAGLALGLAAANHLLALLALPALAVYAVLGRRWSGAWRGPGPAPGVFPAVFGFAAGLAPFLIQLVRMLRTFPVTAVMGPAVGSTFLAGLLATSPLDLLLSGLTFGVLLILQFNPMGFALGMWGLWRGGLVSARLRRVALSGFVVYALFGWLYRVSDQFAFYQMAYVFFSLAMGLGAARALARLSAWRPWAIAALAAGVISMPLLYGVAPAIARRAGAGDELLGIPAIGTGARDGLAYYLNPNKRGDYGAETFGRQTLAALPARALVLAEWYTDTDEYFVLRYFQAVEAARPDVTVTGWPTVDPFTFDSRKAVQLVDDRISRQPVFLASLSERYYAVSTLASRYCIVVEHDLYRLYPPSATPTGATCLAAPTPGNPPGAQLR